MKLYGSPPPVRDNSMLTVIKPPANSSGRCPHARAIDHRVQNILQTIEANPACDLTQLAQIAGLSNSRLSHLFKRETGQDLRSFLTHCRLEQAAQLLHNRATPVKEVSYLAGYRHCASFIRAFRKLFGCAPKDYRNASNSPTRNSRFG